MIFFPIFCLSVFLYRYNYFPYMYFLLAYFIEKVKDYYLFFFICQTLLRKQKQALIPNVFGSVMDPQHIILCPSHVFFFFHSIILEVIFSITSLIVKSSFIIFTNVILGLSLRFFGFAQFGSSHYFLSVY